MSIPKLLEDVKKQFFEMTDEEIADVRTALREVNKSLDRPGVAGFMLEFHYAVMHTINECNEALGEPPEHFTHRKNNAY